MKISKKIIISGLLLAAMMIFGFAITSIKTGALKDNFSLLNKIDEEQFELKSQSLLNNYEIIQDIFDDKINEYDNFGSFSQVYEPSLQATYYALYALQAIDKLNTINQTAIKDYILSNYNSTTHFFRDDYAYRYLDTDFSKGYYPLTTVLEVNCYAILSLEILNALDLIDSQDFIDFIWSCYNPITSGFIGQPYSSELNEYFNTSTLDNTYYAIKILSVLTNWDLYPSQKSELIDFINELQLTILGPLFGGFLNEDNGDFLSLYTLEYNLLSCYYAIKSLEIFNMIETINLDNFRQYLNTLYDTTKKYFIIGYRIPTNILYNDTNLAATAIGLELAILTQFTEIDQNGVVNFLLNRRNSYGTWDCSTDNKNRELIDTFEIIRALNDTGEISKLTSNDKTLIANTLHKYFHYNGFSLISDDYQSLNLLYTIVSSFNLYDKISELPITYLYNCILNSSIYFADHNYLSFHSCVDLYSNANFEFRSKPIEYYINSEHKYILDNNKMLSYKNTFYAIDSLIKLHKLDDLNEIYNLNDLVDSIVNSQFLDSEYEYENYGAFLPSLLYQDPQWTPEFRNGEIELEYSYYAIKTLEEILADYPEIGTLKDLGIDIDALYTYFNKKIITISEMTYFCDNEYDTVENKIQKTYYMTYILKALEIYNLDDQKIKTFLEQNLDYSNIKNIYYSWKLSEFLNLDICFDLNLSHDLISGIYDQNLEEFYLTINGEKISQESFQWICEMAKKDNINILCNFNDYVQPGSTINVTVLLQNIVLNYFGPNVVVKYKSEKIGEILLIKDIENSTYSCEIIIPNDLYQTIEGFITVYDGLPIVSEKSIIFHLDNSQSSPFSIIVEEDTDKSDVSSNNQDKRIDIAIPLVIMLMAFPAAVITISYKLKRDSFIESDKK